MSVNFEHYPIVGVTFQMSFDELKALNELKSICDIELAVVRDFHNHYDPNAIGVYMQMLNQETHQQLKNQQIGFISKDSAKAIIDANGIIDATIRYELDINTDSFTGPSEKWLSIGKQITADPEPQSYSKPLGDNPFK